jgi:hypothetical protein
MNSGRRLHNAVEHMSELLSDDAASSPRSRASKSNDESLARGVTRRTAFCFNDSQPMSPARTDDTCVYPSSQGERKLKEWQDSFNTIATMEETSHSSLVDLLQQEVLEVPQKHPCEHEESYQWSEASSLVELLEASPGEDGLPQNVCFHERPPPNEKEGSLVGGVYSPDFLLDRSLAFDTVFNEG